MLKICHVVDGLGFGGLEKTVIEIVSNLKGYEHQVWCLKDKGVLAGQIEGRGITVREFNFSGRLKPSLIYKLVRELKKENFSIVHCHGLFPSIWGRLAAIVARVPIRIVHCQNLYYGHALRTIIKLWLLSYFTTKIIAVSEAVKMCLIKFVAIRPEKIIVIYNSSPDFKLQSPYPNNKIRGNLGLNSDNFVIGTIGRLMDFKGHRFLIEAVAKCKSSYPHCKCIIGGDGPEKENLKLKIKSLNLDDTVLILGWKKDIENLLLAMDVFVYPSILREGLPLALVEAASFSLPLIGTDIGGIPEIILDGVNGFIVPHSNSDAIAEKIKFFIENAAERKKMGESSREEWREKFTLEEMISKIDSLYKGLLINERIRK